MDFSKLLQAILAQFQNVRINWVALLFDPEFHAAVAALVTVIRKHTTSDDSGSPVARSLRAFDSVGKRKK